MEITIKLYGVLKSFSESPTIQMDLPKGSNAFTLKTALIEKLTQGAGSVCVGRGTCGRFYYFRG